MKIVLVVSIVLLLFAGPAYGQLPASGSLSAQEFVWAEKLISEHVHSFPTQTQLALALIKNGKVYFSGVILENDSILPVDNRHHVFEIGSISKVFTASLLTGLVAEGAVQLDDPVNDYLLFTIKDSIRLTFKQLANHTSGLPRMPPNFGGGISFDPNNPYRYYDEDQLKDYLMNDMALLNQPGECVEYSNLGAGLLAFTLTKVTGLDYQQLLEKYLFGKYGMIVSTTRRELVASDLVRGLDSYGRKIQNWDFSVLVGAGGILSSTEDLAKFMLAQFDESNEELKQTRAQTFKVNEQLSLGLGWHIIQADSGIELYCHNGGTRGYSSSVVLDTNQANGVIILSNVSAFHPESNRIEQLCFALLRMLGESSQ